jgi:hypothetical protein
MTSEGSFGQEGLIQNDFVEELQDAPPMRVFEGLLGKSTSSDALRLYFSSELDLFMEFQESDKQYIESIPKEVTGLGFDLQKVWMKPEAEIKVVCRSLEDLRAKMTAELLDILLMPETARGHRHR